MPRKVHVWNGGDPAEVKALLPLARPLGRSAEVGVRWGEELLEVVASAGELVTTAWGASAVIELHLKAVQSVNVRPGEPVASHPIPVPARYAVGIGTGPTFTLSRSGRSENLYVFPPAQPTPCRRCQPRPGPVAACCGPTGRGPFGAKREGAGAAAWSVADRQGTPAMTSGQAAAAPRGAMT
jgi:hypothetical protein